MSTWFYTTSVVLDRIGGQAARVFEIVRGLAYYADVVVFAPLGRAAAPLPWPANVHTVNVPVPALPPRNLGFQFALWRALQRKPVPDVYFTYGGSINFPGLWYARRHKIPALIEVNGIGSLEYPLEHPPQGTLQRALTRLRSVVYDANGWLDYRHLATTIVPVTEQLADYIRTRYGVPRERFVVATNGANPEMFRPGPSEAARERLGLQVPGPLIGYVGSLAPWQGLETLVRGFALALAERPDLTLVVVGAGSQEQRLTSLARQQGMGERVIWTGWQSRERVQDYIQACHLMVAPFALNERNCTTGISALKLGEYMGSGRAVLASAMPGLDFIQREGIGVLFTPDDPVDLARQLLALVADPLALTAMGERARRLAETDYSWRTISWKLVSFVRDRAER